MYQINKYNDVIIDPDNAVYLSDDYNVSENCVASAILYKNILISSVVDINTIEFDVSIYTIRDSVLTLLEPVAHCTNFGQLTALYLDYIPVEDLINNAIVTSIAGMGHALDLNSIVNARMIDLFGYDIGDYNEYDLDGLYEYIDEDVVQYIGIDEIDAHMAKVLKMDAVFRTLAYSGDDDVQ